MPKNNFPSKEALAIAENPEIHYVAQDQTTYLEDAQKVIEEVLKNYIWGVHIGFRDDSVKESICGKIHNDSFFHDKTDYTIEELLDCEIIQDSIIDDAAYICMQNWAKGKWSLSHAILVSHALSSMVTDISKPWTGIGETTMFPAFTLPKEGEKLS